MLGMINHNWRLGGSASVKENFVRLTPDQPSQTGWIFDQVPLNFDEFSILLRFRISGQGKNELRNYFLDLYQTCCRENAVWRWHGTVDN